MLQVGDTYETDFIITQNQVNAFAELSGDKNPLHINADFAATTNFKSPIVHGIFTSAIISKILGMEFPGPGTFYLSQKLDFKRAIYPDKRYTVKLEIKEIREGKHIAIISTQYFETETGRNRIVLDGEAEVKNLEQIP
ncbi:Acyl dehydratase [Reichenbachiella faecimaris]|uniref:Acyl dehydratase n=1 Tax=Reichenbachiella faecimaris TaxID=692418 RepID=A0A1W2GDN0_REIFA|nr:MaoC family dehydratase [Reichenbachiella faecimaris]SMD34783.1 Acyl dehydratase [Reichenbachiella faecimaris]